MTSKRYQALTSLATLRDWLREAASNRYKVYPDDFNLLIDEFNTVAQGLGAASDWAKPMIDVGDKPKPEKTPEQTTKVFRVYFNHEGMTGEYKTRVYSTDIESAKQKVIKRYERRGMKIHVLEVLPE